MNKNIYIGIVIVLVVAAFGYWFSAGTMPQEASIVAMENENTIPEGTNKESTEAQPTSSEGTTGTGSETSSGGETSAMGNVKTFTVTGKNFSFLPNTLSVKKGDTVRITFKNTDGFHDLVIDEFNARTKQMQAGGEETIEFVANKTGTFEYYCSVGAHRAMGMKGTLTVTE